MNDPILNFGVMVVVGMLLGAVFFGGLWMTVQHMQRSRQPGVLFLGSVVFRTAIVLAGIWYFAAGDAMSIVACLVGFIGIRLLATHGAAVFYQKQGGRESFSADTISTPRYGRNPSLTEHSIAKEKDSRPLPLPRAGKDSP